jgi:hypothetical protein
MSRNPRETAGARMNAGRARAASIAAGLLAAAATGHAAGQSAPAPEYRIGDRWNYHVVTGYRQKVEWDETHEVVAAGAEGVTVRVRVKGATIDVERVEKWPSPGVVAQGAVYEAETDRFDPPLVRYKFPLAKGDRWNERVRDLDKEQGPYGPITRHTTVGGWEKVTTPAGTFEAIRMRVNMQLDDETFWRWPTECNYAVWYAPEVGAAVREERRSQWRDKGGQDAVGYHPGQNEVIELTSFTRAR